MDEIAVSTVVCVPPAEVYEFLVDFPQYADYSEYLTDVTIRGDGTPGTEYGLQFAWWKLSYTARSEVTAVEPPTRIDWRLVEDVDATGCWRIDSLEEVPPELPSDADVASRVRFEAQYDPNSVGAGTLDLPRFVSLDWVVDKVRPVLLSEAERVVSRIIDDLEGRPREAELTVHRAPGG